MRIPILFLSFSLSLAAQTLNGITTMTSRTVTLTPDEAAFTILVSTPLDTSQDQVTQALSAAGIPNGTLSALATGLNGYSQDSFTLLYYQLNFTVPASGLRQTAAKLENVRLAPQAPIVVLQYTSTAQASQASIDSNRQTLLPQLIADARKKADTLASAAGLKLGAVQGVNEYASAAYGGISVPQLANSGYFLTSSGNGPGLQVSFSVTVTFATN